MSRIFTVFKLTILQNLRDTGNTLGQMLVFPIVLILILGMALSPMYEVGNLEPTMVGYLNEDGGLAGSMVDEFMAMPEIEDLLDVQRLNSVSQGEELLQKGEITALIHVPQDYSAKVQVGEGAEIAIIGHPGRSFGVSMVETVMESFTYGGNAIQAMFTMGNLQPEYNPALDSIEDQPISASGLRPSAMGYYAVTMLVMIAMYGTMYGAFGMGENNMSPVGLRVKASPIRPREQYIGAILGNVSTIFVSSMVIIAFTHFVYGVSWGDNLPLVLLITLMHVILTIGLGTMAIMVTRDENRASVLLNVLVVASTFLAGGYFKISLPPSIGWIQYISPNFLAQTALFNTIYDGPLSETMLMLAAMAGIIVLSFAVAMVAERRAVR